MKASKANLFVWLGYLILLASVLYIGVQYFWNDPRNAGIVAAKLMQPAFPFDVWKIFFYIHITAGATALITGSVQLLRWSRRRLRVHRLLGRIYVYSIFVSVPAGVYLAFYATGGLGSTIGFLILNTAWFTTTWIGLRRILKRDAAGHENWMLRSYAVTLVFLTFRVLMPLLVMAGMSMAAGFPLAIAAGILINLYVAEAIIRKRKKTVPHTGNASV